MRPKLVINCKKIIILLDNPFLSDDRVEKEIKSLVSNNYEVVVYASQSKILPGEETKFGVTVKRILNVEYLRKPFSKEFKKHTEAISFLISKEKADVIHCHDYHVLNIGLAVKKQTPSIKLVYDAHEWLKGYHPYKEAKGFINKVKAYLVWQKEIMNEAIALKHIDALISISEPILNFIDEKISQRTYLYNVPDISEVMTSGIDLKDLLGIKSNQKLAVFVGNIYVSDIEFLEFAEALYKRDVSLVVFGNKNRHQKIKDIVSMSPKLSKHIFFHDYLTQSERINIISSADFGVILHPIDRPSNYYSMSNRWFEFLAAGLPVFSSEIEAALKSETKPNSSVTTFNKKNVEKKLKSLLNDLESMRRIAKSNVQNYVWKNEEPKLLKLYKDLLT
jgi:glycosyltransferase involved in cell wall biosynthesis